MLLYRIFKIKLHLKLQSLRMYLRRVIGFLAHKSVVCQIINEFNATCSSFLDTVEIPESNEVLMLYIALKSQKELDQQQQANVDCEYLSKKLQHLQQIREGYTEEKEAWEKNIEFFKTPLSLTTVTMRDCAFEHLNDTETLSSAYEHVYEETQCQK